MCTDRLIRYKCGHPHSSESPSQRCEHNLVNLKHPPPSPLFALYRELYFLNTARCLSAYQVVELRFEYHICDTRALRERVEDGIKYVRERGEWEGEILGRLQEGEVGRGGEAWKGGREGEESTGAGDGDDDGGGGGTKGEGKCDVEVKNVEEVD